MFTSRSRRSRRHHILLAATVGVLIAVALPSAAFGQATRTWVSGVGDDVNPCSRTAPCKTFPGAISKTAAGGIIDVLDPGGFGQVTITKSITIDGNGTLAGIAASSSPGVTVNDSTTASPGTIRVTLRDLRIEGVGATPCSSGVNFFSGKSLRIEDSRITQCIDGIKFEPARSPAQLIVQDTTVNNNQMDGIRVTAGSIGPSGAVNRATILGSSVQGNGNNGFEVTGASAFLAEANIFRTSVADNGTSAPSPSNNNGIRSTGFSATVRIANNEITGNVMGLQPTGGAILSYLNNYVGGNGINGAPTAAASPGPQKRAFLKAMRKARH